MRPRSSGGGGSRPSGSDGTDHPFRMTVDSRYKKVAEKKIQLQKLLMAQTVFHLIKAVQVVLMALSRHTIASSTVAACTFGGVAVLSGTLGLRRTSLRLLQLFVFATSATVVLSIFPLVSGYTKAFGSFQDKADYKLLAFDGLGVAQEGLGVFLQGFEVMVSISLLQQLSRRRA